METGKHSAASSDEVIFFLAAVTLCHNIQSRKNISSYVLAGPYMAEKKFSHTAFSDLEIRFLFLKRIS
jgi:hypothetical protein